MVEDENGISCRRLMFCRLWCACSFVLEAASHMLRMPLVAHTLAPVRRWEDCEKFKQFRFRHIVDDDGTVLYEQEHEVGKQPPCPPIGCTQCTASQRQECQSLRRA
jgi:hypothetical protein